MRIGGATLVEVVVALLVLTVAAIGAVGVFASSWRAHHESVSMGLASAAAEGWIERWRNDSHFPEGQGEETLEWGRWGGQLRWRTRRTGPCLDEARVEVTTRGRAAGGLVLVTRAFRPDETCFPS